MTTEQIKEQNINDAPKPGMIDAIIHLGAATTNLAIDQVGNAFTALVHPGEAIDHVKDTLMNISDAMNNSAARSDATAYQAEHPVSDLRGASDGMEYVAADVQVERAPSPFVDVKRPTGAPVVKARVIKKMNHRKA